MRMEQAMRMIRRPEVLQRCGFSNSTMHRLIKAKAFPAPVQLTVRAVAWVEEDVDAWIRGRIDGPDDD